MRQIKFRGKRIDNGEWVKGDLIQARKDRPEEFPACIVQTHRSFNVIEETVGQFTGLTDRNGVEIYENDIVQSYAYSNAVVRFDEYHCAFEVYCEGNAEDDQHFYVNKDIGNFYDIEVIGNIHEGKQ